MQAVFQDLESLVPVQRLACHRLPEPCNQGFRAATPSVSRLRPDTPPLRYGDDLLALCRTQAEAEQAYGDLAELLRPTGMKLKGSRETTIRDLTRQPVEWLGYHIDGRRSQFKVTVAAKAWDHLYERLVEAHDAADAPLRAVDK